MDGINEENANKYIATYSKLLSEVEKVHKFKHRQVYRIIFLPAALTLILVGSKSGPQFVILETLKYYILQLFSPSDTDILSGEMRWPENKRNSLP